MALLQEAPLLLVHPEEREALLHQAHLVVLPLALLLRAVLLEVAPIVIVLLYSLCKFVMFIQPRLEALRLEALLPLQLQLLAHLQV